ncbi:unnamed protein product [Didymodactylos carnosus]|uniref:TRPM SLOG domain-containing protein n=1 Tax=Didymodactylos carnosus TaxID=1234261 RepID=A0A8S2D4I2_9BILA|nr:unnamed protein product [Didymodactylos carnosus]CAF3661368.1 unnamed protein product [Didymodactylos carnosus]
MEPKTEGTQELEPHHTQFILFDDGTLNPSGVGEFGMKLAREISSTHRTIPLLAILVAGRIHTLKIFFDICEKIPVVIIDVAIAAESKKFLHEETCHFLLTNIWYDRIEQSRRKYWFYFDLITLNIPYSIRTIQKPRNSNTKMKNSDCTHRDETEHQRNPRLEPNGIDYPKNFDNSSTGLQCWIDFHNSPIAKYNYNWVTDKRSNSDSPVLPTILRSKYTSYPERHIGENLYTVRDIFAKHFKKSHCRKVADSIRKRMKN